MSLLAPWFLAGLAALAVPVVIHLINRERKTVVPFPSLMFIQRVPYKSVRRQKLRHLLLFALRCLALALFVAAFARPFLERAGGVAAGGGARDRVVLLDRSYSMGYGTRWDAARDSARAAIAELGPADRVTLVAFANDAATLNEPAATHAEVERALSRVTLSAEGTRFGAALKLAGDILAPSTLPNRDIVLVSDFQRRGWSRQAELRLPAGIEIRTVDVSSRDVADLAVTSVSTDRDGREPNAPVTVTARLSNTGPSARTVDATLELAGRAAGSTRVTVPAAGSAQVRFAAAVVPGGVTRGVVRIPGDALTANNSFAFTLAPDEAVSVLVVNPPVARANQALFFRRAIEIGDAPRFRVDVKSVDSLAPRDFGGRGLVVLNEVAPPGGELGAALRAEVRDGAGLLFLPGDVPADRIPREWATLLRLAVGDVVNLSAAGGSRLARIAYSSPVFEPFAAPGSGDFASAHIFQRRSIRTLGDSGVLAWYDDGTPALVERSLGLGRVMVWTSSLDDYWTDLPTQPVFLPFVRQVARHTGRYSDSRPWFTAGEVLDLTRHGELMAGLVARGAAGAPGGGSVLTLHSPSGRRTRFTDSLRATTLTERGFYELRGPATAEGSGRPVAVNVDLGESDLSHMEPAELVAAALAGAGTVEGGGSASDATASEKERGQRLWWYLLVGAFVVMAAETLLSNRLSRVATA
jgi:hypothetical protein